MRQSPLAGGDVIGGVWVMIVAMQIAPMIDALAKLAIRNVPSLEVACGRFVIQALLCLVFAWATGQGRHLIPPLLGRQILRGLMLALTSLLFISSLKVMPLVDAFAIAFVEPMLLTALSALILKEKVGVRRWAACCVGFVGCLVVARPNYEIFGFHALLPLGSATAFAFYHLLTRQLAGHGTILASQFITGLAGAAFLGVTLVLSTLAGIPEQSAIWPHSVDLLLIFGVGLASLTSHGMIIVAFQKAPAMVLAPLGYLEIIAGTIYGYFFFGDFPHPLTWIGIAIIISSGLYIINRERIKARDHARKAALLPSETIG